HQPRALPFVRLPERFALQWLYADGEVDDVFPARLPAGRYSLSRELAAYVAPVPRRAALRGLRIKDRMQYGSFALVGLTLNHGKARFPEELALDAYPSAVVAGSGPPGSASAPEGRSETSAAAPPKVPQQPFEVTEDGSALTITPAADRTTATGERGFSIAGGLEAHLRVTPCDEGLTLGLTLVNRSSRSRKLQVVFPRLSGVKVGAKATDDWLFLPTRHATFSQRLGRFSLLRTGATLPVQFVALFDAGGCVYLRGMDLTGQRSQWVVDRSSMGATVSITSEPIALAPGARVTLPSCVLGWGAGDWHLALRAHRRWLEKALGGPPAPRKAWFRRVFCFHQQFAHSPGWFDADEHRWHVDRFVKDDLQAFGVAEYFHFFDWGASPTYGRVGDYSHYEELGGLAAFRAGVERLQQLGVRVGLYFEGYLVDSRSLAGRKHLNEWSMLDAAGKPQMWADSTTEHVVCPWCPSWQSYVRDTLARVEREVGADGYYLDELGFEGRTCWSKLHGHPVPASVAGGEMELLHHARAGLPADRALYTEEVGLDIASHLRDGAFTYAVASWANGRKPSVPISTMRFACPGMKTFEIVAFAPFREPQVWSLAKYTFFNGEGLWIQGATSGFSDDALELLRKVFRIEHEHADAFTSSRVTPLLPTLKPGVWANEFLTDGERVITLYNSLHHTVRGELLRVLHRPGARYFDAWNDKPVQPRLRGSMAYVSLTVGPEQVGCLVQKW
ncbi:MAG: hypothetical protein J7M26_05980, partial [Armatimonadetes bacterium]|nr:hypothetical protein [Armatimonadota bacterium]